MRLLVIGGSDAGISAALRARELDPTVEVTAVVADRFLNFSTCPACGPLGTVCTPISGC